MASAVQQSRPMTRCSRRRTATERCDIMLCKALATKWVHGRGYGGRATVQQLYTLSSLASSPKTGDSLQHVRGPAGLGGAPARHLQPLLVAQLQVLGRQQRNGRHVRDRLQGSKGEQVKGWCDSVQGAGRRMASPARRVVVAERQSCNSTQCSLGACPRSLQEAKAITTTMAAHVFELDDRDVVQRAVKGHVGVVLGDLGGRVACKRVGNIERDCRQVEMER